jgi:hypothetical protein
LGIHTAKYTKEFLDFLSEEIYLDVKTGELWWRNKGKFSKRNTEKPVGHLDKNGYKVFTIAFNGGRFNVRCARLVYAMYNNDWPIGIIDHIDGNRSNDRPENLRDCTYVENNHNRRPSGSCDWLGVYKCKVRGNYIASTTIAGKKVNLGRVSNAREAALIYNHAAIKHFPHCARYNQVFEDVSQDVLDKEV